MLVEQFSKLSPYQFTYDKSKRHIELHMPNDPLRDNAPIIATLMSFCMLNRVTLTLILQPSDAVERTLRVKNSLMRYWEMTKALNNDEDCKNVH